MAASGAQTALLNSPAIIEQTGSSVQVAVTCEVTLSISGSTDGVVGGGDGVTSSNTMVDPLRKRFGLRFWTVSNQKYRRPNRPPSHHAGEDGVARSLGRGGRERTLR
ncbi:hypothetical protein GCM10009850_018880 [Nonomuraea monospora]|uniref:Uncharacterized protein n=1 Tax=Nonomuraea monospora TaxID=568818 RepID=A0ABN3CBP3_9ACTN